MKVLMVFDQTQAGLGGKEVLIWQWEENRWQ